MKAPLVLASASPRRRELMAQAGLSCHIMPALAEEKVQDQNLSPEAIAVNLAYAKAQEVAGRIAGGEAIPGLIPSAQSEGKILVIGADTVVSLGERILGKPKDRTEAAEMLRSLSGRTHRVWTGLALVETQGNARLSAAHADSTAEADTQKTTGVYEPVLKRCLAVGTRVDVAALSDAEIEAYLATGEADDKAGAYGIQGRFAIHVRSIRGDYFNVVGLPIATLYTCLRELGYIDMDN